MDDDRRLTSLPVRRIIAAIDETARRLRNPVGPLRPHAARAIAAQGSMSEAMADRAIDWTFEAIDAAAMRRLIISELGSDDATDGVAPGAVQDGSFDGGCDAPDEPVFHFARQVFLVAAGAIFQPAVNGAIHALLVKSAVTVKCSSHETILLPAFVETLREVEPLVGDAVTVLTTPSERLTEIPWQNADAIVAYGSDETVAALRKTAPTRAKFVGHGHKLSIALVGRAALRSERAARAAATHLALDTAMYDQTGCLSPHAAYVEPGEITAVAFAGMVEEELDILRRDLPPAPLPPDRAAAVRSARIDAEWQVSQDDRAHCVGPGDLSHTVIVDPDPAFRVSPLGRTLFIKSVDTLADLPKLLGPLAGRLQAVGLAPDVEARPVIEHLRELGASYVCPLGRMQRPPLDWQNAGVPCLRSLVL